jgi:hypothetical protein
MIDSNPHESYPTYTITILNNLPNLITILYLKINLHPILNNLLCFVTALIIFYGEINSFN